MREGEEDDPISAEEAYQDREDARGDRDFSVLKDRAVDREGQRRWRWFAELLEELWNESGERTQNA